MCHALLILLSLIIFVLLDENIIVVNLVVFAVVASCINPRAYKIFVLVKSQNTLISLKFATDKLLYRLSIV